MRAIVGYFDFEGEITDLLGYVCLEEIKFFSKATINCSTPSLTYMIGRCAETDVEPLFANSPR